MMSHSQFANCDYIGKDYGEKPVVVYVAVSEETDTSRTLWVAIVVAIAISGTVIEK